MRARLICGRCYHDYGAPMPSPALHGTGAASASTKPRPRPTVRTGPHRVINTDPGLAFTAHSLVGGGGADVNPRSFPIPRSDTHSRGTGRPRAKGRGLQDHNEDTWLRAGAQGTLP